MSIHEAVTLWLGLQDIGTYKFETSTTTKTVGYSSSTGTAKACFTLKEECPPPKCRKTKNNCVPNEELSIWPTLQAKINSKTTGECYTLLDKIVLEEIKTEKSYVFILEKTDADENNALVIIFPTGEVELKYDENLRKEIKKLETYLLRYGNKYNMIILGGSNCCFFFLYIIIKDN
jgi:hypothetical protein